MCRFLLCVLFLDSQHQLIEYEILFQDRCITSMNASLASLPVPVSPSFADFPR